jgi:hypothetical protein
MNTSKTRTTIITLTAVAMLSAISTAGIASAAVSRTAATAQVSSAKTTTLQATTVQRTRPGTTLVGPVRTGTVSQARIEGGATGDGLSEKECEALGDKAEELNAKGFDEIANNGDVTAGQADGAAAQAVVDYGMDNGCFFYGLPW